MLAIAIFQWDDFRRTTMLCWYNDGRHEQMEVGIVSQYFAGWRRKCGVVTLIVALAFAGGWIRSFVIDDFIEFPFSSYSFSGMQTQDQSLIVFWFSQPEAEDHVVAEIGTPPTQVQSTTPIQVEVSAAGIHPPIALAPEPVLEDSPAPVSALEPANSGDEWIVDSEGGAMTAYPYVISCAFHSPVPLMRIWFGAIVIPLALLSAGLLLWKPRRAPGLPADHRA